MVTRAWRNPCDGCDHETFCGWLWVVGGGWFLHMAKLFATREYTLGETRGPGRDFDGRCNESLKQTSYKQIPL